MGAQTCWPDKREFGRGRAIRPKRSPYPPKTAPKWLPSSGRIRPCVTGGKAVETFRGPARLRRTPRARPLDRGLGTHSHLASPPSLLRVTRSAPKSPDRSTWRRGSSSSSHVSMLRWPPPFSRLDERQGSPQALLAWREPGYWERLPQPSDFLFRPLCQTYQRAASGRRPFSGCGLAKSKTKESSCLLPRAFSPHPSVTTSRSFAPAIPYSTQPSSGLALRAGLQ